MTKPSWAAQIELGNEARRSDSVAAMNSIVTPCPVKPKFLGIFSRRRHRFEDYTSAMNTMTYSTLSRCRDCGWVVRTIGEY